MTIGCTCLKFQIAPLTHARDNTCNAPRIHARLAANCFPPISWVDRCIAPAFFLALRHAASPLSAVIFVQRRRHPSTVARDTARNPLAAGAISLRASTAGFLQTQAAPPRSPRRRSPMPPLPDIAAPHPRQSDARSRERPTSAPTAITSMTHAERLRRTPLALLCPYAPGCNAAYSTARRRLVAPSPSPPC